MIRSATEENIRIAAELLRQGEVVAFPTETVYGLGANALNAEAVEKVYSLKGRPASNPLIVHLHSSEQIREVCELPERLHSSLDLLSSQFWPGPLSVVFPKKPHLPERVTAGLDSVAVRIPSHPIALRLLKLANLPIAAPSANRSNYVSATRASHVQDCFGKQVSCILDGGCTNVGIESTVLSLLEEVPTILRPGAVSREALEEVLGKIALRVSSYNGPAESPGLGAKHYSPRTPIKPFEKTSESDYPERVGLILLDTDPNEIDVSRFDTVSSIAREGGLEEIAARLYETLRDQDKQGLDLIVIDSCDESGIGLAIMDRIRRASRPG